MWLQGGSTVKSKSRRTIRVSSPEPPIRMLNNRPPTTSLLDVLIRHVFPCGAFAADLSLERSEHGVFVEIRIWNLLPNRL
jgi:hypothetical protein